MEYSSATTTISLLIFFSMIVAAAASSNATADPAKQNSHREFLEAHNKARAAVGVPPLKWNQTVANYARDYAHKRKGDCKMEHSMGPNYGENLAEGWGLSPKDAVGMWTSEKADYDPASKSCKKGECLHYTQVVWRTTTQLGCASTKCTSGAQFVICSYYPPGNYIGQKPY